MMTFDQFRATRTKCADLGATLGDARWEHDPVPATGFVYLDCLYIEDVKDHWPDKTRASGRYYLILERDEIIADNLTKLEWKLYEFARDSGYCDDDETDPENIYNLPGIRQSIEEDRR